MILRWLKRLVLGLIGILALVALLTLVTPQGRTVVRTALFLPQILPGLPMKPQEWFSGHPSRLEVSFPLESGLGLADLYLPPKNGQHSAIMLFLGVNPAGRDDSRVVSLAEGLARAGSVVMIPWSNTMTQRQVTVEEVDNLVWAFQYLVGLNNVDTEKAGMAGFCVGASLVTIAAQDFRIRDRVKFVNFFGGYYNARDLVLATVSSSRFDDDIEKPWTPDHLTLEVVRTHLIKGIRDESERDLLNRVFILKDAVLDSMTIQALSPESRAVFEMLSGTTLGRARELIESLSPSTLASLDAISPSTRIGDLRARILIMHDREDDLIPSEESRRLSDAMTEIHSAYHTEFSLFDHMDPTRSVKPLVYAREVFKMFMHMYNILREVS